jgi:hypothetical protein
MLTVADPPDLTAVLFEQASRGSWFVLDTVRTSIAIDPR